MLSKKKFPHLTFNRLTLAVLLSLSGQAAATVDYSGDLTGDNLPASGSQDWLNGGDIMMGKGQQDSVLSITGGSKVSGTAFGARSDNNQQTLTVSGAGSELSVGGLSFSSGTTARFENGALVKFSSGIAENMVVHGGARISVAGAGTRLWGDGSGGVGVMLLWGGGIATLSEDAVIETEHIFISEDSLFNIGGEQGGTALAPGIVELKSIEFNKVLAGGDGILNFNHTSSDYVFSTKITSRFNQYKGIVSVESGTTTLTAQNDYKGDTRITGGTLKAGAENAFSANSTYDIASGGTLDLNGFSNTLGDTVNAGTINLAGNTAGTILTVNGNYTGNDGTLIFGTELEGDSSITDRLIVTGDVSGTTNVRVTNLGGSGAETLNGIELITVQGSADSSAFTQQGRIVAGAYDYRLVRGDHNWYLTNRSDLERGNPIMPDERIDPTDPEHDHNAGLEPWMPIIPDERIHPIDPIDPVDPGDGDNGGGDDGDDGDNGDGGDNGGGDGDHGGGEMVLRPEAGAYAANLATASSLFDTRMSDRQGTYYLDPVSGEEQYTSMWLRTAGNHNRVNAGSGQLSTRANSFVTMLGGDIAATDTARLGLMAGYGNSKSNTHSKITGYGAKGQINGYTTGLYGTWFAEGTDEKGLWTDSTLQYSWFNNSVNGDDEAGESYKSKGISASLSAGYVIPLGEGERTAFFLQPQARVGWSGIKADDHTERNGTRVQSSGQDNVSSSLGVKAFMKGHSALDDNTGRQFGLFTEVNWINNSKEYAVRMDGVSVSQSGSRNIAEARVGVDGALGGGFGVKGTIGQQVGDKGWSDTSAAINFSYKF